MDANRFDAVARTLGQGLDRRRVTAAIAGMVSTAFPYLDIAAKKRKRCRDEETRCGDGCCAKGKRCHKGRCRTSDAVGRGQVTSEKKRKKKQAPPSQCQQCGACLNCLVNTTTGDADCSAPCSAPCASQSMCQSGEADGRYQFLATYLGSQGYVEVAEPTAIELRSADGNSSGAIFSRSYLRGGDANQSAVLTMFTPSGSPTEIYAFEASATEIVRALEAVEATPTKKRKKKGKKKGKKETASYELVVTTPADVQARGMQARSASRERSQISAEAGAYECSLCNDGCGLSWNVICEVVAIVKEPQVKAALTLHCIVGIVFSEITVGLSLLPCVFRAVAAGVIDMLWSPYCENQRYQELCGGFCSALGSSACCGTKDDCPVLGQICDGGVCLCPQLSDVICGGQCTSSSTYQTDRLNCGYCGNRCPSDRECRNGSCCLDEEVICDGECLSQSAFDDNQQHCGSCGNACGQSQRCIGRQCRDLLDSCQGQNDTQSVGCYDPTAPYCRPDDQGHAQCYPCANGTELCDGACCGQNERCIDDHCRELLDSCQGVNDQNAIGCYDPALPVCCFDEQGHANCFPEGVCSCPGGAALCGGGCCGENQHCLDGYCYEILSRCQGENDDNEMICIDPAMPVCCPNEQGRAQCYAEGSLCCGNGQVCSPQQGCNGSSCIDEVQCCQAEGGGQPLCCYNPSYPLCMLENGQPGCYQPGSHQCGMSVCGVNLTCTINSEDPRVRGCCAGGFPVDGVCCENPGGQACIYGTFPATTVACAPAGAECCPTAAGELWCVPPQYCHSDNGGLIFDCRNP